MAETGFADRLAYVRWLRNRGRLVPETDTEFASSVGVGTKWLTKWKSRPDAPEGRTEMLALEEALKPLGVVTAWLYDGKGQPPEPRLWKDWVAALEKARPAVPASAFTSQQDEAKARKPGKSA